MSDLYKSDVGFLQVGCRIFTSRMSDFNKSDVGFLQVGCRIFTRRMLDVGCRIFKVGCRMAPISFRSTLSADELLKLVVIIHELQSLKKLNPGMFMHTRLVTDLSRNLREFAYCVSGLPPTALS